MLQDVTHGEIVMPYQGPEPVRFLSLSNPRSGTMMLNDMLMLHPALRMHNLYARDQAPGAPIPASYHCSWLAFMWNDPQPGITHLGTAMHRVGPAWIKQYTIFSPDRYWQMLADRHDRYLLLHRLNLLRQYLSHKVGQQLGYDVHQPRSSKPVPKPVRIPIEDLIHFVRTTEILTAAVNGCFPGALVLTYERLCSDWKGVLEQVCAYLGLPWFEGFQLVTLKQESRPLAEAIENYSEVADWCNSNGHGAWL